MNCPKRPRVFPAQVIDEDAEPSSVPNRDRNDDVVEERGDPSPETEGELIGSQYYSDQEGHPLDDYDEYIEVEDLDAKEGEVVYIGAGRMIDNNIEISDTSETDITNDDHTNDISDGTSTLVDSVNTSMKFIDIPSDMYPNELLHA